MIDLKNTTFIIPIKIDHYDRSRNIFTVLTYLLNNFETNVILKEVDMSSKFTMDVLPSLQNSVGSNIKNLTHIFEESYESVFFRTRIINEMLSLCKTDVVANYDADVLLKIPTILEAVYQIEVNKVDLVYPYGHPNAQFAVEANNSDIQSFLANNYNFKTLEEKSRIDTSYAGHVQFFKRSAWIEGGMENENFKGSAPEDFERLERFSTLGYNVIRLNDHFVYHMEHYRGKDSYPVSIEGNPFYKQNYQLYEALRQFGPDELRMYYNNQEYLKKYR